MTFSITPSFTDKVFQRLGKLAKTELNLESNNSQVQFCRGFIESLQKESNVTEDMAIGIVEFLCEKGANWLSENHIMTKEAATEEIQKPLDSAKQRLFDGVLNKFRPMFEPKLRSEMNDVISHNAEKYLGKAKELGGAAWDYMKSPQFLNEVAPMLAGGLIGGLAPKAFGGGTVPTVLGATGGALLGRHIAENRDAISSSSRDYIDSLRKQISETFKSSPI